VSLDRLEAYRELLADGAVRPTLGHEREHFQLARGELVEQLVSTRSAERAVGGARWPDQGRRHRISSLGVMGALCHRYVDPEAANATSETEPLRGDVGNGLTHLPRRAAVFTS
jgi:hypothetical protein